MWEPKQCIHSFFTHFVNIIRTLSNFVKGGPCTYRIGQRAQSSEEIGHTKTLARFELECPSASITCGYPRGECTKATAHVINESIVDIACAKKYFCLPLNSGKNELNYLTMAGIATV